MISPNHTDPVEKQSVILSREITKLEDVYSFTEVVQEQLSLHVSLTLILFGDDRDSNFESNLVKSETDDFKSEKESGCAPFLSKCPLPKRRLLYVNWTSVNATL